MAAQINPRQQQIMDKAQQSGFVAIELSRASMASRLRLFAATSITFAN